MKFKKVMKIILTVIGALIILGVIFANIDYNRIKNDKKPIIAIYMGKNDDTKIEQYYGLGYTITKCPYVKGATYNGSLYKLSILNNSYACLLATGEE